MGQNNNHFIKKTTIGKNASKVYKAIGIYKLNPILYILIILSI